MDVLHEPLIPILRHVLAAAGLPRSGMLLDLASGSGLKLPLLREACGPHVSLLALDRTIDSSWQSAACSQRSTIINHIHPVTLSPCHLVTGDAHALPLADDCCGAACCIAALNLFADPIVALRELRRVVRPGGPVLVVSGTQAWAEIMRWPHALAEQIQIARLKAHGADGPLASAPDVGDELAAQFTAAGFATPRIRAFLLDESDPVQSELALLPWRVLRPTIANYLNDSTRRAADQAATTSDIELCSLVLAAQAIV